ncbi:MAG: M28 family peptidase [bacterium]
MLSLRGLLRTVPAREMNSVFPRRLLLILVAAILPASASSALADTPPVGPALAGTALTEAAGVRGTVLAWHAAEATAVPASFVPLHQMETGTVGLLDAGTVLRGLPSGTRVLGSADDGSLLLVTPSTAAMVARGELPPAWSAALASAHNAGRTVAEPTGADLRAIPVLASDGAVVLLRLPSWLSAVAEAPGCRAQRIDTVAPSTLGAGREIDAPPLSPAPGEETGPIRTQRMRASDPTHLAALARAVNTDRMFTDLDTLSTGLQTRSSTTPQFDTACQYALGVFQSLGLSASLDPFTGSGHAMTNVVAVKTGTLYPSQIVIISGHLDSTSPSPTTLAPGAEDNGSGSVAVLEAARLLANLPCEKTIHFILFAGEEQGLLGSTHYATEADNLNLDIKAMLTMDMIAYNDPAGADLWIEGFHQGTSSVWIMNQLDVNARTYCGLTTYLYPGEGWGSDHEPFHTHGFPAVLAIENEYDSYPCYHQTCDTVDKLDAGLMRKIAGSVLITTAELAGVTSSLGWISGSVSIAGGGSPAGAVVSLSGTSSNPVTVGADGLFAFSDLLPADYTVAVTKTGCVPNSAAVTVPAGGGATPSIVLQALQSASITGVVRDALGAPLAGALIEVEGVTGSASSAADGSYTMADVPPGSVAVCASIANLTARGKMVTVASGQVTGGVDFVLRAAYDFEVDGEGFTTNAGWARGTDAPPGAHSGTNVWGTVIGANYANCADYRLDIPPVSLVNMTSATLRCWNWYRTETGYDGGNLQVSTDGGVTWTVVPPNGGYVGNLTGSCNPLAGQQGFQGTSSVWLERVYPLDSYLGQWVRLRFRFGADSGLVDRGWYLDDFSLIGQPAPIAAPEGDPVAAADPSRGATLRIVPNPAPGAAGIVLRLPKEANGRCEVFEASGRRIAVLAEGRMPAGERTLRWDGRDAAGRAAAAGIYWAAWTGPGVAVRVPIVLLK